MLVEVRIDYAWEVLKIKGARKKKKTDEEGSISKSFCSTTYTNNI
jgi:hypothetical protein